MSRFVSVEGLSDLDAILGELKFSTAKGALRRVAIEALQPMDDAWRAKAPKLTGHLSESGGVGTKLTRSQKAALEKDSSVEVYCGPSGDPAAIQDEFGNRHQAAEPFMRPAWDETQDQVLDRVAHGLAFEIQATSDRAIKRGGKQGY